MAWSGDDAVTKLFCHLLFRYGAPRRAAYGSTESARMPRALPILQCAIAFAFPRSAGPQN